MFRIPAWPMLVFLALVAPVIAQPATPAHVVSPTRGVVVFGGLESQLADAVASHRTHDVDALLAADFEQRESASPGQPLPRAQWLAGRPYRSSTPAIAEMAVHDFGTVAVVSFTMHEAGSTHGAGIVDVWRMQGGNWQLQVRYRAPTQGKAARAPTGKE